MKEFKILDERKEEKRDERMTVIVLISYIVGEIGKIILRKKRRYKYIPAIVGSIGGILGIMIYYISPEIIHNVRDPYEALTIGIVSGLASTGGNEVIKQIIKKGNKNGK